LAADRLTTATCRLFDPRRFTMRTTLHPTVSPKPTAPLACLALLLLGFTGWRAWRRHRLAAEQAPPVRELHTWEGEGGGLPDGGPQMPRSGPADAVDGSLPGARSLSRRRA